MADDAYLASMAFNTIFAPALKKLAVDSRDQVAVNDLRSSLLSADVEQPGFLLEFVKRLLLSKQETKSLNLQECMLRMQANLPADDLAPPGRRSSGAGTSTIDPLYQELSYRSVNLRKILSRIPDEMTNRRSFLETIKEIASCIKKLLDAANTLIQTLPENSAQSALLEQKKREFVKFSKKFSNTLKDYFKGEESSTVFASANQLIHQTTLIMKGVPEQLSF